MAETKKKTTASGAGKKTAVAVRSGSAAGKKTGGTASKTTRGKTEPKAPDSGEKLGIAREIWSQILPYLFCALALFIGLCYLFPAYVGVFGRALRSLFFGLLSGGAVLIPLLIVLLALKWRHDFGLHGWKTLFSFFVTLAFSIMMQAFTGDESVLDMKTLWYAGLSLHGGGALGGFLGTLLLRGIGKAGTLIVSFTVLAVFGLFLFGLTPKAAWVWMLYEGHEARERMRIRRELNAAMPPPRQSQTIYDKRAEQLRVAREQAQQRAEARAEAARTGQLTRKPPRLDDDDLYEAQPPRRPRLEEEEDAPVRGATFDAGQASDEENGAEETVPAADDAARFELLATLRRREREREERKRIRMMEQEQAAAEAEAAAAEPDGADDAPDDAHDAPKAPAPAGKTSGGRFFPMDDADLPETSDPVSPEPIDAAVFDAVLKQNRAEPVIDPADAMEESSLKAKAAAAETETDAEPARREDGTYDIRDLFRDGSVAVGTQAAVETVPEGDAEEAVIPSSAPDAPDEDEEDGEPLPFDTDDGEADAPAPAEEKPPVEKKPYEFPPVTMLKSEPPPENTDVREELQSTAKKLVDTLASFKVMTRIVNVSRGPVITRYELAPEEGVRVRAISNLVDDIALQLATSGVRIEAPIPGKAAVGIEVPNRVTATVHLREMLENDRFAAGKSRLTVALGMDVAGECVFVDLCKMPHLLIAGATGMGKSVCINSMIVSLLYKSSPEDVKLILIDPKKVELNIYNGLPHLMVPVLSDPKKAAGALINACNEMERRFGLIEEVGARNLEGYNAAVADDPSKKKLPLIVIIIDELADLMMTAPDDVEDSICRLAQKARAAGIHLVIGTQRPSVDVITGLIKANVPSRIAFTVASQTDSRVILDQVGAEKLIGRGDMLYAPVGSQKPRRVQGAFVSEDEVISVVDFIKRQTAAEDTYDSGFLSGIEEAAALCRMKKGGRVAAAPAASEDGEEEERMDSMLKPAIELAVDTGKISTSLIQRTLHLGYGRSASLIDKMEQMGIVSAPDGQKPRDVLINRQQYMEMVLNQEIV